MTTLTDLQIDQAAERASQVRFGRFLVVVIATFFWALGWIAGRFWTGVVFCAFMVKEGWQDGTASRKRAVAAHTG